MLGLKCQDCPNIEQEQASMAKCDWNVSTKLRILKRKCIKLNIPALSV